MRSMRSLAYFIDPYQAQKRRKKPKVSIYNQIFATLPDYEKNAYNF